MKYKSLLTIPFLLLLFSGIAEAATYMVSPTGSNSDQDNINQALQSVYDDGKNTVHFQNYLNQSFISSYDVDVSTVYLNPGVYTVSGQVKIGSNTHLTGDPNAVIRVWSGSNQWFYDGVGVIGAISEPLQNVEIDSIQIDGNCKSLPRNYANSGSGNHNAERLIDLRASTGSYSNSISIHDVTVVDAYSDGIHIAFAQNVNVYNVFASNCQHSALYFVDVLTGSMHDNRVAGITSDDIRLDNCVNIKVFQNLLYAFIGDSGGAYQGGQNDIQVGDQGFSHGGGSAKPDHTTNIEIFNNTFSGVSWHTIWKDADGLAQSTNVYIHDNVFLAGNIIETNGISFDNPPTVAQSQQVFTSIFDILKQAFSFSFLDKQIPINASVDIISYNNSYNPHSLVYVTGESLSCVKYDYNGLSTVHYIQPEIWKGDIPNQGNAVYLAGKLDTSKLKITCYTSQGYSIITDFNITEINDESSQVLNPKLWAFVGTLIILGLYIFRHLRRVITF